jgi:hypothetical protein
MEIEASTIDGVREAVASGETTATAVAELHFERIRPRYRDQ